jgi:hypothetical protein
MVAIEDTAGLMPHHIHRRLLRDACTGEVSDNIPAQIMAVSAWQLCH